jgi:DNA-binding NtrC family response regulator
MSRLENKEHASVRFNSAAMLSLQQHFWPGNVRELANLVERMCIIKPNEVIGVNDLPQEYQYASNGRRMHFDEPAAQATRIVDQTVHPATSAADVPAQAPGRESTPSVRPGPASLQSVPEVAPVQAAAKQTEVATAQAAPVNQPEKAAAMPAEGTASTQREPHQQITEPKAPAPQNNPQPPGDSIALTSKQMEENLAMMPLNAERLEQYLANLEKNLLEVAMQDSANIMKFAADRLRLNEGALRQKLQRHGMG